MTELLKPSIPVEFMEKIEPIVKSLISAANPTDYKELELTIAGEEASLLFFFEPVFPPEHLVITGAGHIGKSLAHFGSILGFEVTVIDDRPYYANSENIPDADHFVVKDIGEAMSELNKRNDTYVVMQRLLNHVLVLIWLISG